MAVAPASRCVRRPWASRIDWQRSRDQCTVSSTLSARRNASWPLKLVTSQYETGLSNASKASAISRPSRQEQQIALEANRQPPALRWRERHLPRLRRIAHVEHVHHHRQRDVAVRVKPLDKSVALVTQVSADRKLFFERRGDLPRTQAARPNFAVIDSRDRYVMCPSIRASARPTAGPCSP